MVWRMDRVHSTVRKPAFSLSEVEPSLSREQRNYMTCLLFHEDRFERCEKDRPEGQGQK